MRGTLKQRSKGNGSVTQRSAGSWQLRYYGPPDESGQTKQVNETVKGSRREAERTLRERLSAIENGSYITRQRETVGQFLARGWTPTVLTSRRKLSRDTGRLSTATPHRWPIFPSNLSPPGISKPLMPPCWKRASAPNLWYTFILSYIGRWPSVSSGVYWSATHRTRRRHQGLSAKRWRCGTVRQSARSWTLVPAAVTGTFTT